LQPGYFFREYRHARSPAHGVVKNIPRRGRQADASAPSTLVHTPAEWLPHALLREPPQTRKLPSKAAFRDFQRRQSAGKVLHQSIEEQPPRDRSRWPPLRRPPPGRSSARPLGLTRLELDRLRYHASFAKRQ